MHTNKWLRYFNGLLHHKIYQPLKIDTTTQPLILARYTLVGARMDPSSEPRVFTSNNAIPKIVITPKATKKYLMRYCSNNKNMSQSERLKNFPKPKPHWSPTWYNNNMDLLAEALCLDTTINLLADYVWDDTGEKLPIRQLQNGPILAIWDQGLENEWGPLLPNGVGKTLLKSEQIAGTGTIFSIQKSSIPKD